MKQRTQPFRSFVIRWERLKDLQNGRRLRKFVTLAAAPRNEYLAPWVAVRYALHHSFYAFSNPVLCGSLPVLCWFPQVKKNGGACEYMHLRHPTSATASGWRAGSPAQGV